MLLDSKTLIFGVARERIAGSGLTADGEED
jgi:hypothetical protein